LGGVAAVTAMLDRILHHGHVLKCAPRSWRPSYSGCKVKRLEYNGNVYPRDFFVEMDWKPGNISVDSWPEISGHGAGDSGGF
jgi:hypothetical protein